MIANALTIRPVTPDDAEAVSAVIAASYGALYRGWYPDDLLAVALPFMSTANPALLSCGTYYVAEDEGEIVGCGGWTPEPPLGEAAPGLGHIRHFATHPNHLRRGIASALLMRCREEALAAGLRKFHCLSSLPAEAFYARLGFRRMRKTAIPLPGGVEFPVILMESALR